MGITNKVKLKGSLSPDPKINGRITESFLKGDKGDPGEKGDPGIPGQRGEAGHSPAITASKSGTTTTIYADGVAIAQIEDGEGRMPEITAEKVGTVTTIYVDGEPIAQISDGADGRDGTDGHTPVITTSRSGKMVTIFADGVAVGTVSDGVDGQDGQDGHSPQVTASKAGKVTTISVDGTPIATVNDGSDGQDGTDGKSAYEYAVDGGYTGTEAEFAEKLAEEYVKTTDYATKTTAGIAVVDDANGIGIESQHKLYINFAPSNLIKSGTGSYRPIPPPRQHESAFYGLAKAAGDTTQSASSNAVGAYTDDAKIAIQKMLGIYQAPWELIREDTFTNATEADYIISVDGNGDALELTDVVLMFETPKQATASAKGQYGDISFFAGSTLITQIECGSWTQDANGAAHGIEAIIRQEGNLLIASSSAQATNANSANVRWRYGAGFDNSTQSVKWLQNRVAITSISILKVTGTGHYRLYGKRKWS